MPLPAFRGHFVHGANRHRRWQWPTTAPVWNWSVRWRIRIWLGGRIHASSGIHVSARAKRRTRPCRSHPTRGGGHAPVAETTEVPRRGAGVLQALGGAPGGPRARVGRANDAGHGGPQFFDAERLLENWRTNFLQERSELLHILMRRHEHNAWGGVRESLLYLSVERRAIHGRHPKSHRIRS